ncbi:MAG TPA: hypothetical protein VE242_06615 [Chthoniobacterales bacterium]|nr:hypothetical protein [Chthoniobacterales bacterium]
MATSEEITQRTFDARVLFSIPECSQHELSKKVIAVASDGAPNMSHDSGAASVSDTNSFARLDMKSIIVTAGPIKTGKTPGTYISQLDETAEGRKTWVDHQRTSAKVSERQRGSAKLTLFVVRRCSLTLAERTQRWRSLKYPLAVSGGHEQQNIIRIAFRPGFSQDQPGNTRVRQIGKLLGETSRKTLFCEKCAIAGGYNLHKSLRRVSKKVVSPIPE